MTGKASYTNPDNSTGANMHFTKNQLLAPALIEPMIVSVPVKTDATKEEAQTLEEVGFKVEKIAKYVDVVMLNYNGLGLTDKSVETLYCNTSYPFKLIVIDNQSTDGSAEWLSFAAKSYPNMEVHYNDELDGGYAEGINHALKYSKAPYVLLLNNDILVPPDKTWLTRMVAELESSKWNGIISPKLLYPNSRIQYAGMTFTNDLQPYHIGRYKRNERYTQKRQIPAATFACVLIRRELLDATNGLDAKYAVGTFEDTDFCMKTRFSGYHIIFDPSIGLYHFEGATNLNRPKDTFAVQISLNYQRFLNRWAYWLQLNREAQPELYQETEQ